MTIAELLLPEADREMATTRRALERVPDDRLGWKPHACVRSFFLNHVIHHRAQLNRCKSAI
jgi:hypothetical protein